MRLTSLERVLIHPVSTWALPCKTSLSAQGARKLGMSWALRESLRRENLVRLGRKRGPIEARGVLIFCKTSTVPTDNILPFNCRRRPARYSACSGKGTRTACPIVVPLLPRPPPRMRKTSAARPGRPAKMVRANSCHRCAAPNTCHLGRAPVLPGAMQSERTKASTNCKVLWSTTFAWDNSCASFNCLLPMMRRCWSTAMPSTSSRRCLQTQDAWHSTEHTRQRRTPNNRCRVSIADHHSNTHTI